MGLKIYTKAGDRGKTSLFGGTKLSKDDIRIEAYGTVDELNAHLGLLKENIKDNHWESMLLGIQNNLFVIGSNLAVDPNHNFDLPTISESDVEILEEEIDKMQENLRPLKHFVLPGGNLKAAHAHVARTVCRRSERRVVTLSNESTVDDLILKYLNRLSDYLFVLSRAIVAKAQDDEVYWNSQKGKG